MSDKKERKIHPFVWPAVGIFVTLGLLLGLMLMSNRQYGPGQAYLNQNTGGVVYDRDPGSGITRPRSIRGDGGATAAGATGDEDPVAPATGEDSGGNESAGDDRLGFYERLAAGLGAAKGFEPEPNAADCDGHCDCPQGHVCRPDIGRCVETEYHPIFCCIQDGCPTGEACVQDNGSEGTCGAGE